MDQLNALSTGRKIVLAAAALLLIDTFFAWQKVEVSLGDFGGVSASANAWHGFWGVLLGLATIATLAWVAAWAFGVELPGELPDGLVTLALGVVVFASALLKNLVDDYSAWASYVGIVLGAVVAYGAWRVYEERGEERPRTAATTSTEPPAAAPPPATPEPSSPPSTDVV
ncbi:MAG: hypothetical protein ACM33B_11060 [Pseudomonadota bacterium]